MTEPTVALTSQCSLKEIVDRLQSIRINHALRAILPHFSACKELLDYKSTIDLSIFGRLKAGKRSLSNFLSNRSVLPVGVIPVTAVITWLRRDPPWACKIRYARGRTENVPVESAKSLVLETEGIRMILSEVESFECAISSY